MRRKWTRPWTCSPDLASVATFNLFTIVSQGSWGVWFDFRWRLHIMSHRVLQKHSSVNSLSSFCYTMHGWWTGFRDLLRRTADTLGFLSHARPLLLIAAESFRELVNTIRYPYRKLKEELVKQKELLTTGYTVWVCEYIGGNTSLSAWLAVSKWLTDSCTNESPAGSLNSPGGFIGWAKKTKECGRARRWVTPASAPSTRVGGIKKERKRRELQRTTQTPDEHLHRRWHYTLI